MVQEGREIAKQEGKADMNDRKEEITSSEPPERGGAICTKRTPGIPTGGKIDKEKVIFLREKQMNK